jgi:hypothetical protein
LALFCDPKDEGDLFPQNICWHYIPEYKALGEYSTSIFRAEVSLVGKMAGYMEMDCRG